MGETDRLELRHPNGVTPIWIGADALKAAGRELDATLRGRRVFVVTSPPILQLHRHVLEALRAGSGTVEVLEVADGEAAKTVEIATSLWRRALTAGAKRDSVVVAFGGGSIGDLAGFVAATLVRGVDFVQIPTTLLAQVDAAIGGKTAVNLPEAKNSVGALHHPVLTIADTAMLATLGPRDLRSGLFEVVKTAAMLDADLFALVEERIADLLAGDPAALAPVIAATAAAKIRLVEEDPREADRRRLLNFGHTLGHALESALGPTLLSHGEAVGYGMLFALREAVDRGLPAAEAARIARLIETVGLPRIRRRPHVDLLLARIRRDKKASEQGMVWVVPSAIGEGEIVYDVGSEGLHGRIDRFLATIAADEIGGPPDG